LHPQHSKSNHQQKRAKQRNTMSSSSRNSRLKGGTITNNSSENGSSNGEVGGNNSDNSALISLGNTSFGFNFDSEEGMNGSPNNSTSEEGDSSDQGDGKSRKQRVVSAVGGSSSAVGTINKNSDLSRQSKTRKQPHQQSHQSSGPTATPFTQSNLSAGAAAAKISSDSSFSLRTTTSNTLSSFHSDAASEAVANLHFIAKAAEDKGRWREENLGYKMIRCLSVG
jgi:hypothetical protein